MNMRVSRKLLLASIAAIGLLMGVTVACASAAEAPEWKVIAASNPTNFEPGSSVDTIRVMVINVGGAPSGCSAELISFGERGCHGPRQRTGYSPIEPGSPVTSPVTITDSLPSGLSATEIAGMDVYRKPDTIIHYGGEESNMECSSAVVLSCTEPLDTRVDPGDPLIVTIPVSVAAGLSGQLTNTVTVSGGGAASASVSTPITVGSHLPEPSYGPAPGGVLAATATSQAGAHANVTSAFFLSSINHGTGRPEVEPVSSAKDIRFDLPPGLVGNTVGMPRCTMAEVVNFSHCPRDTMVGTSTVFVNAGKAGVPILSVPVYNIAPAPGEPAAFGFNTGLFSTRLDTSVLSNGDYGVRVTAPDITQGGLIIADATTVWGVPAEHNGPGPDFLTVQKLQPKEEEGKLEDWLSFGGSGQELIAPGASPNESVANRTAVPLLTNPSQCATPLEGTLETDSWENQGVFASESTSLGTPTGCNLLSLGASLSMLPDTLEAGAPAGYAFDLGVAQNNEPEALASPDVRKVVATLPQGTVVSPSAADGLGDCSNEQFALHSGVPGGCPRDSQVGTVRVKTPALEERLTGEVFLATPECGASGICTPQDAADGSMIRLFVQLVGEGESGIVVKLEGTGQINQQTGQITTTFNENPQLPFSEFQLSLQGGERATLANPRTCGPETTSVDLTSWSAPFSTDTTPTSNFNIDENCFGPQFDPSFTAGTTSNQAGGFSPFTVSFGRTDSDEFLNGIQVRTPPGLLGMLSRVSLCEEPQASLGACGPESLIGETTVETGPGADPFLVTGGKVYITGPYKGAPYGLSIVVPAKAGPYTLSGTTGDGTVVVRSAINVNPENLELTVTADPLPTMLDGIPLQLRLVNVTIDRPGFIFNPTNCGKQAIGGTLTSTQAASANVSSSFQVTNCAALKFKPKFTVSTSGKTSRANGASIDAKLSYPAGAQGTQANVAKFKVDLPKQLPSRLTTLQKACTAATFNANPANCPAASVIGTVRVSTPVLSGELTGPVYFVSHGGEAFPNLVIVLQGDGVRVDVVGDTFISKAGITSTTLNTTPDVPFNSFELYLPEGKYSALAANGNLCESKLAMPTAMVAQNGLEIHQSTPIAVTGCAKAKSAKAKGAKAAGRARKAGKARESSHGHGRKS
jgi:hypothetical protein